MPKGSTYPVATSPDAIDLVGVQAGVTKKLSSTLLATQAELDAHAHTGTYVARTHVVGAGNGTTDDTAAFTTAQTAAAGGDISVPPGTYLISNLTLSSGRWHFAPGAKIKVPDGVTLTVSAEIVAGHYRIFTGWPEDDEGAERFTNSTNDRNRIVFTKGQTLHPEWFGATGNGVANDKPAWQRTLWALPKTVAAAVKAEMGRTYLFKNGGVFDGPVRSPTRPGTAFVYDVTSATVDLNGATLKAGDNTRYSLVYFHAADSVTPPVGRGVTLRTGTLDGNRAGNEAQYLGAASDANKGYGALFTASGYKNFRCEDIEVIDTIHSGVVAVNATDSWFERCKASGGYPMKYDVNTDQAHYFKTDKDYGGRSFFSGIDTDGGSHGVTVHYGTAMIDASDTFVFMDNLRHRNAAEAAIHVEQYEQAFLSNFSVVIDNATFSSGNVADVFFVPGAVAEAVLTVSNGSLVNAELKAENAAPTRLTGTISDVHVLQNLSGLARDCAITADFHRVVNCSVRGKSTSRVGGSTRPAITCEEAIGCVVDYATLVSIFARTGVKGGKVTNGLSYAVDCYAESSVVADVVIEDCFRGVHPSLDGAELHVSGCLFKNISRNCIDGWRITTHIFSRNNTFMNFGIDTTALARERAALGGDVQGMRAEVLVSKGDVFYRDGTNANAYTVALDRNGTTPVYQDVGDTVVFGVTGPANTHLTVQEGFRAYRSSTQAIAAATSTVIVYNTEVRDEGADYDPATGQWTVPETGWYDVGAGISCSGLAANQSVSLDLYVGATEHTRLFDQEIASTLGYFAPSGSAPLYLTAGNVVTIRAYSPAAFSVAAGAAFSWFTAKRR